MTQARHRPSPWAVLILVLGLVSACSSSGRPARRSPHISITGAPATAMRTLLARSWAGNGTRGFFVEATSLPQAMSLYATRWWLQLDADRGSSPGSQVDRHAVAQWVAPIAVGTSTAAGAAARLPEIERVDDAVTVLDLLGVRVDSSRVAAYVETMRRGSRYGSGRGGDPDWGDTAIALGIYRRLGLNPPAAVTAALLPAQARAVADRSPADLLPTTVPVLTTLDDAAARARRSAVRAELAWIASLLPTLPPVDRLSVANSLSPLGRIVGARPWPARSVCASLVVGAAGIAPTPGTAADPQLTAAGRRTGCLAHVDVPPWTPSGWPNADVVDGSLPASVDGLRVADALGVGARYLAPLRAEFTSTWLPSFTRNPTPAAAVAGDLIAHRIGVPPLVTATRDRISAVFAAAPNADAITELLLGTVTLGTHTLGGLPGPTAKATTPTMNVAIVDELKARLSRNPDYHHQALDVLGRLRVAGSDLFATAPGGAGSTLATIIAAWVRGEPFPERALRRTGNCSGYLSCTELARSDPLAPLQIAAAQAVAATDGSAYPLAY